MWGNPLGTMTNEEYAKTILQGRVGDCAFIASTFAIARIRGEAAFDIEEKAKVNGIRQFSVFMRNSKLDPLPKFRVVSEPTDAELLIGAKTTDAAMWLPLLEKAYLDGFGTVTRSYSYYGNANQSLSRFDIPAGGEDIATAIKRLSKRNQQTVQQFAMSEFNNQDDKLRAYLRASQLTPGRGVLLTWTDKKEKLPAAATTAGVPGNHAFIVVGYNALAGTVTIRNPWNSDSTWGRQETISFQQFKAWFIGVTWAPLYGK